MPGKVKDRTGEKWGKWTVLRFDYVDGWHGARFICRCECGAERSVLAKSLREGHSKSCGCIQKLPKGQAARNSMLRSYKRGAKKRGLEFTLTEEQFDNLTGADCYYCGIGPMQYHENLARHYNGGFTYNGIDRLHSDLGYTNDNCVTACGTCNLMKKQLTPEDFIEHCRRVVTKHSPL